MSKYFHQVILVLLCLFMGAAVPKESTFYLLTLTGAGSQSDTAARYFAPLLETHLGQPVVVMNVPGGEGLVGMRTFMGMGEGCEAMMVGSAAVLFAGLHPEKAGFDAMEQFVPIHGLSNNHSLIVVNAALPIHSLADLVKYHGKEQRLVAGSISPQTTTSLGMLDKSLHIQSDIVNYKQSSQMAVDLAGGRLDYSIVLSGTTGVQGLLDSGKLRAIAVVGNKRISAYPEVATIREQGYTAPEVFYWSSFFANKNTSPACRKRLEGVVAQTLNSELGERYAQLPGNPQRFAVGSAQMGELLRKQLKLLQSLDVK